MKNRLTSRRMTDKTIHQMDNPKITKAQRERLKRVAALPDGQIDTSDIPEVKDRAAWVRVHKHPEHRLHRVLSRLLSIRLPERFRTCAETRRIQGSVVPDVYQVVTPWSARTRARTGWAKV